MEAVDAEILQTRGNGLRRKHGRVRRGLVAHRAHHHTACDLDERFGAGEIGDVHECVVLCRVDVRNAQADLTLLLGRAGVSVLLGLLRGGGLFWLRGWVRHAKGQTKPL